MKLRRIFCLLIILSLTASFFLPVKANTEAGIRQDIIDACTYGQAVDLSGYKVQEANFHTLFQQLYTAGDLPWYTAEDYQYDYYEDGTIATFIPITLYNGDLDMAAYEEKAAEILQRCILPGMTQWQIALSLHDFIISHTAYDESLNKNSGYDIVVEGSAVCAGYALAYQDLLQRAGIECRIVTSAEMEHAWNLVCIDGNWYHADLTWDDPSPNSAGLVSHDFFLLTDAEISAGEEPHYGWEADIHCTDTRFSQSFWRNVYSQICFESSDVCYLLRSEDYTSYIYRRSESTGKETQLYKESTSHIDIGYGDYKYEHIGLSLRENRLWFNSLDKILSMKTDGTNLKTEYTHSGNTFIYSSSVADDQITLTLRDHDGHPTEYGINLDPADTHSHNFTRTVYNATCTDNGYTLSLCDCGLEAASTPKKARGHEYICTEEQEATLFDAGSRIYACTRCDDSYTEEIPKITLQVFFKKNFIFLIVVVPVFLFACKAIRKTKKQGYDSY